MIKLSKRLLEITKYISDNMCMIDIGCDHALLDIYLMQHKKNISIIASDINANALENAKKNIKKYGLSDKIPTILSNGLENINMDSIDTVVISGMGSHTITSILYQDVSKLKKVNTLIIQSNNDLDFLRKNVTKIGYYIDDESLVLDSGIIYTVIVFKKGFHFYTKKELYLGPILMKKKESIFFTKVAKDLKKLENIYSMIPKSYFHYRMVTAWRIRVLKKIIKRK